MGKKDIFAKKENEKASRKDGCFKPSNQVRRTDNLKTFSRMCRFLLDGWKPSKHKFDDDEKEETVGAKRYKKDHLEHSMYPLIREFHRKFFIKAGFDENDEIVVAAKVATMGRIGDRCFVCPVKKLESFDNVMGHYTSLTHLDMIYHVSLIILENKVPHKLQRQLNMWIPQLFHKERRNRVQDTKKSFEKKSFEKKVVSRVKKSQLLVKASLGVEQLSSSEVKTVNKLIGIGGAKTQTKPKGDLKHTDPPTGIKEESLDHQIDKPFWVWDSSKCKNYWSSSTTPDPSESTGPVSEAASESKEIHILKRREESDTTVIPNLLLRANMKKRILRATLGKFIIKTAERPKDFVESDHFPSASSEGDENEFPMVASDNSFEYERYILSDDENNVTDEDDTGEQRRDDKELEREIIAQDKTEMETEDLQELEEENQDPDPELDRIEQERIAKETEEELEDEHRANFYENRYHFNASINQDPAFVEDEVDLTEHLGYNPYDTDTWGQKRS